MNKKNTKEIGGEGEIIIVTENQRILMINENCYNDKFIDTYICKLTTIFMLQKCY